VSVEYGARGVEAGRNNEFAKGERSDVMHRTVLPPAPKSEPGPVVADPGLGYNRRPIDARKNQHRVR
jgi:hypothetical protein